MPSKKKKYNARFPAGRIKKIMQTDEEVGKVAQAVPVIISRTLELFVESLLTKSAQITQARNAKTLTPSHMKQCILSESRFDFLKDLVKNIPDATTQEDNEVALFEPDFPQSVEQPPPVRTLPPPPPTPEKVGFTANFYTEQSTSKGPSVIQFGSVLNKPMTVPVLPPMPSEIPKIDFSIKNLVQKEPEEPKIHINLTNIIREPSDIPPLIPIARNNLYQSNTDNLCIDEDYDN